MRRRLSWETLVAVALLAAASNFSLKAALTEELHKTYPIDADGRVSLKNVNGAVHISAWDRNEVQVDAIKRADTRDVLDEATIVIDSSSSSISVRTRYPEQDHGRRHHANVEYTLKVPRHARLFAIETVNGSIEVVGVSGDAKMSTVNGSVRASGLGGDAHLTTVNGQVEASFDRLNGTPSINLETVNGGISLSLPAKGSAELDAHTVHGRITNDFGIPQPKGFKVGGSLSGHIGSGVGARVKLNTVNGGIRIYSTMDGRRVLNT
jgi:DUF4097 and DUF4098 domain-containing protein YvlB